MSDSLYTARASTKAQVLTSIGALDFNKTPANQYDHDDAQRLVKGTKQLLEEVINTGDCGNFKGMSGLCEQSPNPVNGVKATVAITADMVMAAAKKQFAADKLLPDPPAKQDFAVKSEAQDEANRLNDINQAVIGAKEGTAEALKRHVGSDVLDAVLRTADGNDRRGIDEYTIADIIDAIMEGADRPTTPDVHERLIEAIGYEFNFAKKCSVNLETIRTLGSKLGAYGIGITDAQATLIVLSNIDAAMQHDWGRAFVTPMAAIRKLFPYDHIHDAKSLKVIMKELSGADGQRVLKEAPSPTTISNKGSANAVDSAFKRMERQLKEAYASDNYSEYESDYTAESANSASSASSESTDDEERAKRARRARRREERAASEKKSARAAKEKYNRKKSTADKERRNKTSGGGNASSKSKCKYCVKYDIRAPHEAPPADCYFNKRNKGWRPSYACKKMGIEYKSKGDFDTDTSGSESS